MKYIALLIAVCSAALFVGIYCYIPTLYYRYMKKPPFRLGDSDKKILLSFDDGPDPRYTRRLLQILGSNGVHAVFFVVAEKAAQNPEILREIVNAGHLVGLHSLEHRDAWLQSPAYQRRDFEHSLALLKRLGCPVSFYRAPWGHLTITSLLLARRHRLKILLWSVMAQDWERASTSRRILKRLMARSRNGSVICLHDSGCGKKAVFGAPEHMLQAVSELIPLMLKNGFHFVLPDEGGGEYRRETCA